jgi:hypothetical protein
MQKNLNKEIFNAALNDNYTQIRFIYLLLL